MFEAEYARRRTTAEAEAGRICSGDTVYLAGGPLLPVDFAAALHRRAAELHGVRVLNYLPWSPWLCLPTRLRGRLSNRVDFLQHLPAGGPAPGPLRLSAQPPAQCGQGLDPRGAGVRLPGTHGLPYGQAWLLFPGGLGLH